MPKNLELYQKILDASNMIHNKSLKGSGNYIILNSKCSEILEKYEEQRKKKEDRKKKLKQIEKLSTNTDDEINNILYFRKNESEKYRQKIEFKHKKH